MVDCMAKFKEVFWSDSAATHELIRTELLKAVKEVEAIEVYLRYRNTEYHSYFCIMLRVQIDGKLFGVTQDVPEIAIAMSVFKPLELINMFRLDMVQKLVTEVKNTAWE